MTYRSFFLTVPAEAVERALLKEGDELDVTAVPHGLKFTRVVRRGR